MTACPPFSSALCRIVIAALLVTPLALTPVEAATPARKAAAKPAPRKPAPRPVSNGELAPGTWRWLSEGPWNGPLTMVVSIEKQMVHVYMGDTLIGMASVSTGMQGHSTPTGQFPILQKRQWHRSNIYSNAPMPYMQRLTWDGIALHAGHNPGRPASHGCIRLPLAFAKRLFELTQLGTLVSVQRGDISPVLALDPLILTDPGSTIVTFTPRVAPVQPPAPRIEPPAPETPRLDIDPEIFRLRLSTGRRY
jgi:hypothetical protein